jgi:signal transduction histidine kinase
MSTYDPLHGSRVLIADGERLFAEALAKALEDVGYVVAQTDPTAAANTVNKFAPDLLLWDIEAPGASSDIPAQIAETHPDLPIVVMARRPDRRRESRGRQAPNFIDKRFGLEAALQVIGLSLAQDGSHTNAGTLVEDAKQALRETNRAKLELISKMSHELRTPLNAIIGFSELMMGKSAAPLTFAQMQSYSEMIHVSGRHLLDLINDVLDLAKAESGKLLLEESEADLAQIISSIRQLFGARLREAGLELNERVPNHLRRLWCDESKLKRMLVHLVANAMNFTPSGGCIDLEVSETPTTLIIAVRDTGLGMEQEDLERVLDAFVQVETTLSRGHEGAGLGLPLVKALAALHGGTLRLESQLNRGTTARVLFPLERLGSSIDRADRGTNGGLAAVASS